MLSTKMEKETLSDGSTAYSVSLIDDDCEHKIVYACVDAAHALALEITLMQCVACDVVSHSGP